MAQTTWDRPEDLEPFLAAKGAGLIFKHSTRCSISAEAERQVAEFARTHPQAAVYRVLVIESRPASNAVAEKLGVPHASPQAILVRDGAPVWTSSHRDITAKALERAFKGR